MINIFNITNFNFRQTMATPPLVMITRYDVVHSLKTIQGILWSLEKRLEDARDARDAGRDVIERLEVAIPLNKGSLTD